jgi:hypothetical protein
VVEAFKPGENAKPDDGSITVESKNDTDGVITSNASATNSTTGVGVAVAINIVTYENVAYVGDSRLIGESLTITADIYEKAAKNILEDVLSQLIEALNVENIADALLAELEGEGTTLKSYLEAQITARGIDLNGKSLGEMADILAAVIKARLQASLDGTDVKDSVDEDFQEVVNDTISYIAEGISDAKVIVNIIKNDSGAIKAAIDNIKDPQQRNEIIALSLKAIAALLGSNDELDGIGHKISTQTVSGVGASNVGVAGSAAISVVNGTTKAIIADRTALTDGDDIRISGDIIITADGAQKIYTTASSSADAKGRADKNKAATNGSNSANNGTSPAQAAPRYRRNRYNWFPEQKCRRRRSLCHLPLLTLRYMPDWRLSQVIATISRSLLMPAMIWIPSVFPVQILWRAATI